MDINTTNNLPLAADIDLLPGQRVVRVGDYFFPVGVGGNFMPKITTVESMKLYKCQQVSVESKTWSGWLAEDNGVYFEFAELPTTGLQYVADPPTVGEVYSEDARIQLAVLFDGVSLSEDGTATLYAPGGSNVSGNTATLSSGVVADGILTI